ncbi:MAG: DUF4143 domain-containing protein [Deltaproteobacteria bacterium]|nr:DUF4143 domain-containing protein [Deltaproteobacteria bacterium]
MHFLAEIGFRPKTVSTGASTLFVHLWNVTSPAWVLFMERDISGLGFNIPIPVIERLWLLLAHYHGQTVNYHKLAAAADISIPTLKKYLAILERTYMVRLLPPAATNLKKVG